MTLGRSLTRFSFTTTLAAAALAFGCGGSGHSSAMTSAVPATVPVTAAPRIAVRQTITPLPQVSRVLGGDNPEITPDLDGQVVEIGARQIFLVHLGGDNRWTLAWDPADASRSWASAYQPRGAQGYYSIDVPHRAVTLTATGTALCPAFSGTPCSPISTMTFQVTIVTGPTVRAETFHVTSQSDGTTVHAVPGDTVDVRLDQNSTWTVAVDAPDVLAEGLPRPALPVGENAYLTAVQPGEATITAIGQPSCPAGQTCNAAQVLHVTVVVEPN